MSKHNVLAALWAAAMLSAAASATTYTTVVTTVMENDDASCQQEYQQSERLNHCMMWTQEYLRGRTGMEPFLRSAVANPQGYGAGEEHMEECCSQLQRISSQCRCPALMMMMLDIQKQPQAGMMEKMEPMKLMVENIPSRCGMQSPSSCPVRKTIFV